MSVNRADDDLLRPGAGFQSQPKPFIRRLTREL